MVIKPVTTLEPPAQFNPVAQDDGRTDSSTKMRRGYWTTGEESTLRRLYPNTPIAELVIKLNRPMGAIYGKVRHLGLKRSETFFASEHSGRMHSGSSKGVATRFKQGRRPRKTTSSS